MDKVIAFCAERGKGNAPTAPFVHERGNFEAVREVFVTTKSTWTDNRKAEVRQPMTYLGRVQSNLVGGLTDLDGVTKKYLCTEGLMLVDNVRKELSKRGGLAAGAAIYESCSWMCRDNQVALLVNMLRYALLKRIDEATEDGIRGEIPDIEEGPYRFCTSTIWDEGYPEGGKMTWPGGDIADARSYPALELLSDLVPRADLPTINLRGLDDDQSRFVLMMCGKWNRQSRYRLDFGLHRLAETILYRSDGHREIRLRVDGEAPPMLTSKQAYSALEAYVAKNRLLAQMSVARGLVLRTYCQYLPVAIDGAAWLQTEWVINLPIFRSVRGRFTFLTEGDYTVSRRGLSETLFFGGELETLNFAGIAACQALYYGRAVRFFRWSTEERPEDLMNTCEIFTRPDHRTSVAMAEVVRAPVPGTGMPAFDIVCNEVYDMGKTKIVLWMKSADGDVNLEDVVDAAPAITSEVKTSLSKEKLEKVLWFLDDIRGGFCNSKDLRELRDLGFNEAQQMYMYEHILRYADLRCIYLQLTRRDKPLSGQQLWEEMRACIIEAEQKHKGRDLSDDELSAIALCIFDNIFINLDNNYAGDTPVSPLAGSDEVRKIEEARKTIKNLADLFAAVLGDQSESDCANPPLAKWTDGQGKPKKPVLTAEETASGVGLVRVILKSWPIPGVPTYIRQATGQRYFRLFDKHYEIRVKDLDRTRHSVRGDMGQMWKFAVMMKLMGWEVELDMRCSEDSRKNFAYTPDGNVPTPPSQSKKNRGRPVVVTSLERGKDGAMIPHPCLAGKDVVIRIDVESTGEKIFAGLQATGDKKSVTLVSNPVGDTSFMYSPGGDDMDTVVIRGDKHIVIERVTDTTNG